jgi:L-asparaginase
MQLALIETGGTINGILSPEQAPPQSCVLRWLDCNRERFDLDIAFTPVVMKDSRAIDDTDRAAVAAAIEASLADCILIPHGTYTMPETGVYLLQHLSGMALKKSIVLVGSLIPLEEPDSDAPANLEFALERLRSRVPGVGIVMEGRSWDPGEVRKDLATGKYVPLRA